MRIASKVTQRVDPRISAHGREGCSFQDPAANRCLPIRRTCPEGEERAVRALRFPWNLCLNGNSGPNRAKWTRGKTLLGESARRIILIFGARIYEFLHSGRKRKSHQSLVIHTHESYYFPSHDAIGKFPTGFSFIRGIMMM